MNSTDSPTAGHSPNSNADASNREALPPGTRVGDFEIVRTIGSGGFGIVYLAHDRSLDREVAIKEFLPAQLAFRAPDLQRVTLRSASFGANYDAGLNSFVNEAKILARFNHPGIVKVHRFWEANGTAYMVMPYVHGPTLRDVRRSMKLPPTEAWFRGVLDPLLDALAMLHAEGIYHRDIAPDNILLPSSREPVLLDFGAARRVIGDRTQTFTAVLKPSYAPIEQYAEAKQLRQGPWTDLYALGAVVVYMLRAVPPPPSTVRSMHDEMPLLLEDPPAGVSASFLCAIQWALAVRPQDRPQSVQQFRNALDGRIAAPLIARRDHALDSDVAHDFLDLPAMPSARPLEAVSWPDPGPTQQTTVAFAMHGDAPTFEKPESATWDTTIKLASTLGTAAPPELRPTPPPELPAQVFQAALQARLARLRQGAHELPRTTVAIAALAVLLVSGTGFALFKTRLPEPSAATWHELGRHTKAANAANAANAPEIIIEEREQDSKPYPPVATPVPTAVPVKEALVQQTSVAAPSTMPATNSSGTSSSPDRVMVTPVRQTISDFVSSPQPPERRAKKITRPRPAKVTPSNPREICGDRNFISAAICMNRRCDEAQYRKHPQCVALAKQREASMRRNQY